MAQKQPGGRPSKRLNILAHAVDLAIETGPHGFTLDALCERSGISKGGVLYHFASVQALIIDMFMFYLNTRLPQWVELKLVNISAANPEIQQLSIADFTQVLQHSPVEPELERLVLKTLTERTQKLLPSSVVRDKLAAASMAQKLALYAALGQRMAAVLGIDSTPIKPVKADDTSANRECALA